MAKCVVFFFYAFFTCIKSLLEENVLYFIIYKQVNPFERNNSHTNIKHVTPYNSPLNHIIFNRKSFITRNTFKWLFPRMYSLMPYKVTICYECPVTKFTLKMAFPQCVLAHASEGYHIL